MKRYIALLIIILAIAIPTTLVLAKSNNKPMNDGFASGNAPVGDTQANLPTRQQLLDLTNKARTDNGLQPLKEDPRLDTSAQEKANDETQYHYIAHVSPHDGLHGYHYIEDQHIPGCRGSENLTENEYVNDAQHAIGAFMNSAPHRAAILNPYDTAVGFGVSGNEIVQHFCTSQ